MSIIRIGLGETKNFAEGYDAIFGKKDAAAGAAKEAKPEEKPAEEAPAKKEKKAKKK
ncbi:MAG: hypothetical protein K8T89_17780 [Planctomycetes bacterium]|nr:hypothetical protein [Planctomycetota bacterium]